MIRTHEHDAPEFGPGAEGALMGRRPMTLVPAQVAQVEGLASVLSQEQMADYFGMGRNTFLAIMERQPEVRALYKKGRAKAIGAVAQGLLQRARNGDTVSAIFYLKTQAGWRETQLIGNDPVNPIGAPAIDYSRVSASALRELMDAMIDPEGK